MTSRYIPQLSFSFYRHRSIRADFSGGQITSDAGLLPLRAFDHRHGLTRGLAQRVCDPREEERVQIFRATVVSSTPLPDHRGLRGRQRRRSAMSTILGFSDRRPTGQRSDHNQPSAAGRTPLTSRAAQAAGCFTRLVRRSAGNKSGTGGEILLDVDSYDDPTYGQQQLSFFNAGYDQHMYHPLLIFERHTGCLLAARLRPGRVVSHARIIPLLLRIVPRLQREFPKVRIKLRADAGFATQLLYVFCEFFGLQYAIGIGRNSPASQLGRSGSSVVSPDDIVEPASRSAPFPAFAIVLTPGLISGVSAIRPNSPPPVATCVSWSPTCQAAAVLSFPSIMIAASVRTVLKSLKTALLLTV